MKCSLGISNVFEEISLLLGLLAEIANGKASVYDVGDLGSIPGLGRFLGEGNGNPVQYCCLENPMDGDPGRLQSMESRRVGHD